MLAEADRVLSENGVVSLDGNTTITFQNREIAAENAKYNPDTGVVSIDGELTFRADGIRLNSRNALFDMDDNLFSTGDTNYEININGKRATGSAKTMSRTADGNFFLALPPIQPARRAMKAGLFGQKALIYSRMKE